MRNSVNTMKTSSQFFAFFIFSRMKVYFVIGLTLFLGFCPFLSATFDRIAEINFNLDADDNSVSVG